MNTSLVAELVDALDDHRVRAGDAYRSLYRRDASNMQGSTAVVCHPETTDEVQACVQIANRYGVPFVARGSGTGLAGGAVPFPHLFRPFELFPLT